jgi:hypothetical protein
VSVKTSVKRPLLLQHPTVPLSEVEREIEKWGLGALVCFQRINGLGFELRTTESTKRPASGGVIFLRASQVVKKQSKWRPRAWADD